MAYIGKAPNTAIVNQTTSQSFNGTGSATTFTLNRSVNVGEDLEVFVDNVQQEPGSGKSYTASGTTLTFDEAPPSGTGNVYVIYRGEATINPRLEHDANAALSATTGTFTQLNSDNIRIDGNTISSTDTNGNIIIDPDGTGHLLVNNTAYGANGTLVVQQTADSKGIAIVDSAEANTFFLENDGTINRIRNNASVPLTLETAGAERMRITNDGLGGVAIGGTDPDPTSDGTSTRAFLAVQGSGNRGCLALGTSSNSGGDVAALRFNNGSNVVASIGCDSDSGSTSAGKLLFYTNQTHRMTITSGGNIGINETNPTLMLSLQTGVSMGLGDLSDYSTKGILGNIHPSISSQSLGSTSVDDVRNLGFGSTYTTSAGGTKPTSYGTIRCFEHYNGNLNKGARYLSQLAVGHANNPAWYARNSNTTDGTSYGTWYQIDMTSTSDERSKENVEDAPDQLAVVKQFQVKEFDYIDNADEPRQLGMMAQHVYTFAPEYVTKDDEDPDIMWRIKYNKMVPMLVKALQEATTKIETLETEMTALKARVTALEGN